MANGKRIAFLSVEKWEPGMRAFEEKLVEFEWFSGMSWQQHQKSSLSMLSVLEAQGHTPAEISRRSIDKDFGVQLSAFNLKLNGANVENIFQAYKTFNDGGPYLDLLSVDPKFAKNDCRIQSYESKKPCLTHKIDFKNKEFYESEHVCRYCQSRLNRKLIGFSSKNTNWELEPKSMFYDAIYISALLQNKTLANQLVQHDAFTDIEFNQKILYSKDKGPFNCQARSCAIYVTLKKNGFTDEAILKSISSPEQISQLYSIRDEKFEQQNLF